MKKIILLFLLLPLMLIAQTVYEPLHRDIYEYLGRLAQKGIIEFNDEIKPVSRAYIAKLLATADSLRNDLTNLEEDELEFYKKEFGIELLQVSSREYGVGREGRSTEYGVESKERKETSKQYGVESKEQGTEGKTTLAGRDAYGRYRLFSYQDHLFNINVSPVLGYEFGLNNEHRNTHIWNGLSFYGSLSKSIGFNFDFRDNTISGVGIDTGRTFTHERGIDFERYKNNTTDFNDVNVNLTTSWSWGGFSLGKGYTTWGYEISGNLVLSEKAPSFPYIRLDINPAKWLSFNYLHGWLNSDVADSTLYYKTSITNSPRKQFINKYYALHSISFKPFTGLNISLGESIVYSDQLQISYLIPIMFFRLADHYISQRRNDFGGNAQFFAQISSRNHIKNTHLYAGVLIDEIITTNIFNADNSKNQIGFNVGGSVADLASDNLKISLEYTKVYPFVYVHYIPTLTYETSGYPLGHWIGNNADIFYISANYKIMRGLQTNIWGQYIRKGEAGLPEQQYILPQPQFLFGLRKNYMYAGAEVKYELTHELFVRGRFVYHQNEVQQADKSFVKNDYNEFYFAVYYGL